MRSARRLQQSSRVLKHGDDLVAALEEMKVQLQTLFPYASQGFRLNPFSEFSERPLRASGWAQAARWAFGYVQVRQGKYQVMWPGAAQAGPAPVTHEAPSPTPL